MTAIENVSDMARFLATARELSRMPDVARRLQDRHVAGPDGRCRGCPSAQWVAPVWPCRLWLLADHALTAPAP